MKYAVALWAETPEWLVANADPDNFGPFDSVQAVLDELRRRTGIDWTVAGVRGDVGCPTYHPDHAARVCVRPS